jgi:hypothetical protein
VRGYSATVGGWDVQVSAVTGVTAGKLGSGETFSASLTLFPGGYRVGPLWSNGLTLLTPAAMGIPRAVVSKANALAERIGVTL